MEGFFSIPQQKFNALFSVKMDFLGMLLQTLQENIYLPSFQLHKLMRIRHTNIFYTKIHPLSATCS